MNEECELPFCHNCHRCEVQDNAGSTGVSVYDVNVKPRVIFHRSRFRLAFSNMKAKDYIKGDSIIMAMSLCELCYDYFMGGDRVQGMTMQYIWPAMIWKWLTTKELTDEHRLRVWMMIPKRWRKWWVSEVQKADVCFRNVTLDWPVAVVEDVTNRKEVLQDALDKLVLAELKQVVDEHLYPLVKCPYGCSEYYHKAGVLPFDIVVARVVDEKKIQLKSKSILLQKVRGIRSDYVNPDVCLDEEFMWNPKWKVMPSVAFVQKAGSCQPMFLTCRRHDGGTTKVFVHPPRCAYNTLPAEMADQLAAAVVVPRTVKPLRPGKFTHTARMHEMRGSYGGVDSISICDQGRFDMLSVIARRNESVSIQGRTDTKAFLSSMREVTATNVMPKWLAEGMLETAENDEPDIQSFTCRWTGATFVTLADCVKLQVMSRSNGFDTVNIVNKDGEFKMLQYRGKWLRKLTWVHNASKHGARFPRLPGLMIKGLSCSTLWHVMALHICVPEIWEGTVEAVEYVEEWHGWLLTYLSETCLQGRFVRTNKSPFNFGKAKSQKAKDLRIVQMFGFLPAHDNMNVQVLRNVFHQHGCITIVNGDFKIEEVTEEKTVCIVINKGQASSFQQVATDEMNHVWELRVVSTSKLNDNQRWESSMYARHGGQFSAWWHIHRDNQGVVDVYEVEKTFVDDDIVDWTFAVYVRRNSTMSTDLRDRFLGSMNGQTKLFCEDHDTPLIVAPVQSQKSCTVVDNDGMPCDKKVFYCCLREGCALNLCRQHYDQEAEGLQGKVYVAVTNDKHDDISMQSDDGIIEIDEVDVAAEFAVTAENGGGDDDYMSDTLSRDGSRMSASNTANDNASVASAELETLALLALQQSGHAEPQEHFDSCFLVDSFLNNDEDDMESEADFQNSVPDIVTTNAVSAAITATTRKRSFIGGHVVLNNCGTLLVRKKRKLTGTRQEQNFMQRLASAYVGRTIPLVYPEGMLFPSVFWKDDCRGESILGALPCAFLCQDGILREMGVASVKDHLQSRMADVSFSGSTDFRYICFAFDSVLNLGCRGEDTRVVLNRGMEINSKTYGVKARCHDQPLFDTDSVDSRPVVNRLAAAVADAQATYFYTHTCNQAEHFGIRHIKEWIDSEAILDHLCINSASISERMEVQRAVLNGSSVGICRNWMEVAEIWMSYILKSTEQPLGPVIKMWWRHEYQDTAGNLSHIHALLWLDDTQTDELIQERVRGSLMTLVYPNEVNGYIEERLMSCQSDWWNITEKASKFLRHTCSSRCMKRVGIGNNELRCRVTNNERESKNPREHTLEEIYVEHSEKALVILESLGLYENDPITNRCFPVENSLKATKHYPPAYAAEGIISPCNGRLFVACPGNQNLKVVTGYLASRYLAKYVAGIDENNRVYVGASPHQPNDIELQYEFLHNTKVTGSAIQEAKRLEKRRDKRHPTGRVISEMEMISILFDYEQVYTNIKFVHIPTIPLEERPALETRSNIMLFGNGQNACDGNSMSPSDLDTSALIPIFVVRSKNARIPKWRQLSNSETLILRDQMLCPFSIDATTVFSIRPPELRFVRKQCLYFRWFQREKLFTTCTQNHVIVKELAMLIHHDVSKCVWIDGMNHQITIRGDALSEIVHYLRNDCKDADFYGRDQENHLLEEAAEESPLFKMTRLFRTLLLRHQSSFPRSSQRAEEWREMNKRFIACGATKQQLPVTWFNSVKPTQPNRFLLHILLSMGNFDNELNLLSGISIRDCFVQAELIDANPDRIEQSIDNLTRRYIVEQLVYLPGGSQQFDKFVLAAHRTLRHALLFNNIAVSELPPALYTRLRLQTTKEAMKHLADCRTTVLRTVTNNLTEAGFDGLPELQRLETTTFHNVLKWNPEDSIVSSDIQCEESIAEQRGLVRTSMCRIAQYQAASESLAKSICITGGPGVGKSTLLQLLLLYAASKGLTVAITALMAERSRELGGHHLNQVFAIPVKEKASVSRLAELSVINLTRQTKRMALLQRLDVLFIDELGQVSAEMLSVLDIILRRIRDSSIFMGGVLLICTMDPLQLRPVSGRPALLSPHMLTCFSLRELRHSVRASRDALLRRIQAYTRMHPSQLTSTDIGDFRSLIEQCCTFVDDWNDPQLRPNMLRVFGKKAAAREAERALLAQAKQQFGHIISRAAIDQESTPEGNWIDATPHATRTLCRKLKEPSTLYFFPFAQYEITFNDANGRFSQSQLAVLVNLPTQEQVDKFEPIPLLVAPEGCKTVSTDCMCLDDFLNAGWKQISIGTSHERTENLGYGILGKRCQYGLRHRMACTIHSSMGQNVAELITKVTESAESQFFLWEREQVVVLLSRTHFAKDIYFVGDPRETSAALAHLLMKKSQFSEYIHHLLTQFEKRNSADIMPPMIDLSIHPFHQVDIELPQDGSGYVYILVSVKDRESTYIGQTTHLVRRLKQHNSGFGAHQTADEALRPWALLAFVSGFDRCTRTRLAFESSWQRKRDITIRNQGRQRPEDVARLAVPVIETFPNQELRFVMCSFPSEASSMSSVNIQSV